MGSGRQRQHAESNDSPARHVICRVTIHCFGRRISHASIGSSVFALIPSVQAKEGGLGDLLDPGVRSARTPVTEVARPSGGAFFVGAAFASLLGPRSIGHPGGSSSPTGAGSSASPDPIVRRYCSRSFSRHTVDPAPATWSKQIADEHLVCARHGPPVGIPCAPGR